MPKFFPFRIADHYLYFTAECIVEAMHVHASDKRMTEAHSAKFFVMADGSTVLQKRGDLTDREVNIISRFIKETIWICTKCGRSLAEETSSMDKMQFINVALRVRFPLRWS